MISLCHIVLSVLLLIDIRISNCSRSINPQKLLIATVIDPSSAEIVRDALTLIRSVRLFGGQLNEATFKAAITVAPDSAYIDENSLLQQLYDLNVEVDFITQTEEKLAKTLNKFQTFFLFDPIRFDHFLWLDADILIFKDPLEHLHHHVYPGEIQCVPDIYSYMRRYPLINSTSAVWNPSLSTFKLLGEAERAPHGTCNTGVLFFDTQSLQQFMTGLTKAKEDTFLSQHYGHDRFVDSLYFIYAVHAMGLQVSIMPFSMNYMAMFEVEIMDDTATDDIFLGHFLSDTALYCLTQMTLIDPESAEEVLNCRCVYENKNVFPASPLLRRIETQLLPMGACRVMAGETLPPSMLARREEVRSREGEKQWEVERQFSVHVHEQVVHTTASAPESAATSTDSDDANGTSLSKSCGSVRGVDGVGEEDFCIEATSDEGNAAESVEESTLLHEAPNTFATIRCELLQPLIDGHLVRVNYETDTIHLDTVIRCSSISAQSPSSLTIQYSVTTASYFEIDAQQASSNALFSTVKESLCKPMDTRFVDAFVPTVLLSKILSVTVPSSSSQQPEQQSQQSHQLQETEWAVPVTLEFTVSELFNEEDPLSNACLHTVPLKLVVEIRQSDPELAIELQTEHNEPELSPPPPSSHSTLLLSKQSLFVVVVNSLQSAGHTAYSRNLLHGSRPVTLGLQLQVADWLNVHHVTGSGGTGIGGIDSGSRGKVASSGGVAVAHCCDTNKGVQVVRSLIATWRGSTLLVIVDRNPARSSGEATTAPTTGDLAHELQQLCNTRFENGGMRRSDLKCVMVDTQAIAASSGNRESAGAVTALQIAQTLTEGSVSFVYMDVFQSSEQYAAELAQWHRALSTRNAVLMGSRYVTQKRKRFSGTSADADVLERVVLSNYTPHTVITTASAQSLRSHENTAVRSIVDVVNVFSYTIHFNFLLTYLERGEDHCPCSSTATDCETTECSPAWYFIR